jgi:hypothetical protein
MVKINESNIAWGVIFTAAVKGFYDTLTFALRWQIQNAGACGIATGISVIVLIIVFGNMLIPEEKAVKKSSKPLKVKSWQLSV